MLAFASFVLEINGMPVTIPLWLLIVLGGLSYLVIGAFLFTRPYLRKQADNKRADITDECVFGAFIGLFWPIRLVYLIGKIVLLFLWSIVLFLWKILAPPFAKMATDKQTREKIKQRMEL